MVQQASQIGFRKLRERLAGFRRREDVSTGVSVDQGLMQMPSARVETFYLWPAHEACEMAHAASDLPSGCAEKQHTVGGVQRIGRFEGAFHLTRTPLVLK